MKGKEAYGEFVIEAEELLESMGDRLTLLERDAEEGSVDPDRVNGLFRAMHTLKGLSGMLGLGRIAELSHTLENLMEEVRMGRVTFQQGALDALFAGVELLNRLVAGVSRSGSDEGIDIRPEIRRIRQVIEEKSAAGERIPLEGVGLDERILATLTEYEEHRLLENLRRKRSLYRVEAHFPFDSFDGELKDLSERLKTLGEIISTLPSSDESAPETLNFDLVVGSDLALEEMRERVGRLEGIAIHAVACLPPRAATGTPGAMEEEEQSMTLRSLSQTVRVDIRKLDDLMNIVGELVINRTSIARQSQELQSLRGFTGLAADLKRSSRTLTRNLRQLQQAVIGSRMVPVGQVFSRLNRVVRKLSQEFDKKIDLTVSGEETELDKLMVEEIADPLLHLVRNSFDHGLEDPGERRKAGKPERGCIELRAEQRGNHVIIEVEDDGRGIDLEGIRNAAIRRGLLGEDRQAEEQELLNLLFLPSFSTKERASRVSGRGVGLDVVKTNVARLGGMIDIETEPGVGTRFTVTLPVTLAIIQTLLVEVGKELYAIPLNSILESNRIFRSQIRTVEKKEVIQLREMTLPLLRLAEIFQIDGGTSQEAEKLYVVVVGMAEKRLGLVVDSLRGQQEVVIKPLGDLLRDVPGIAGATELGDKRAILVLDVGALIEEATQGSRTTARPEARGGDASAKGPSPRIDPVPLQEGGEGVSGEGQGVELLGFMLSDEEYALDILEVREIVRPRRITPVPRTGDYLRGVITLRGDIVPVFDLRRRLGLGEAAEGPKTRIIAVHRGEEYAGLIVDSITQVMPAAIDRIEPPPPTIGVVEGEFIRGVTRHRERLVILLNLSRVLDIRDSIAGAEGKG